MMLVSEYLTKVCLFQDFHTRFLTSKGGGLSHTMVKTPSDLFSFSHIRNAARLQNSRIGALRTVSSSPHGMRATVDEQVGRWQQNLANGNFPDDNAKGVDPEMEAGIAPHPRIGIGLPMSNIFATYFGGSLELVTLDGWGKYLSLLFVSSLPFLQARMCICGCQSW
jgi:hypothetical protein